MNNGHQKHTKLSKPDYGQFHRKEWAIIGAPCGRIQALATRLSEILGGDYRLAYVDAEHKKEKATQAESHKDYPDLQHLQLVYTDRIDHHQFQTREKLETYQFRPRFAGMDGVLVNGNHFAAKKQIVILDPKKEESLSRKLDRLTEVAALVTTERTEPYTFLKDHLGDTSDIPLIPIDQPEKLANLIRKELESATPSVLGLVLAGGKSTRMGQDKGLIDFHGKPQREHMADVMKGLVKQVFMSGRPDQDLETDYPVIEDTFAGLGPFGAILSAFRAYPNHAWMVAACDLPLLDKQALAFLLEKRDPSKVATAFHSPVTNFPEPLIALWEPRAYPVLLQFLAQGYSCPRKALINSAIELVHTDRPEVLKNVNDPVELEEVMAMLHKA